MWIMTTTGFYSAREAGPEHVMVRARVRTDLEALVDYARVQHGVELTIEDWAGHDYACRVEVGRGLWTRFLAREVEEIDYRNFKDAVTKAQGAARHNAYLDVWTALLKLQEPNPQRDDYEGDYDWHDDWEGDLHRDEPWMECLECGWSSRGGHQHRVGCSAAWAAAGRADHFVGEAGGGWAPQFLRARAAVPTDVEGVPWYFWIANVLLCAPDGHRVLLNPIQGGPWPEQYVELIREGTWIGRRSYDRAVWVALTADEVAVALGALLVLKDPVADFIDVVV